MATQQSIALVWLDGLCGGHPAQMPPRLHRGLVGGVVQEGFLGIRTRGREHGLVVRVGDPSHDNPA